MRVAIVILNWNTVDYLSRFIPGVLSGMGNDDSLFVADSGSTDGSLEMLSRSFPQVKQIPLHSNRGFAEGYNVALKGIDAKYYLLLNTDIEVSSGWLTALVEWMESNPDCGICSPKLHALDKCGDGWVRTERFEYAGASGGFIDRFGYPFCRGRVLSRLETDNGQYDNADSDVFWVSGAALMIRRSLWEELGGFDAQFFAHMEEIDLCWRARNRGSRVCVVPRSVVYHIGGGTLPKESPFKLKLNYRNSLWMLRRNLPWAIGPMRAHCRIAFRYVLDWGSALVYLLQGKRDFAKAVIQAHKEAAQRDIEPVRGGVKVPPAKVSVLLQSALRGKRIFSYLRRYEGCN